MFFAHLYYFNLNLQTLQLGFLCLCCFSRELTLIKKDDLLNIVMLNCYRLRLYGLMFLLSLIEHFFISLFSLQSTLHFLVLRFLSFRELNEE